VRTPYRPACHPKPAKRGGYTCRPEPRHRARTRPESRNSQSRPLSPPQRGEGPRSGGEGPPRASSEPPHPPSPPSPPLPRGRRVSPGKPHKHWDFLRSRRSTAGPRVILSRRSRGAAKHGEGSPARSGWAAHERCYGNSRLWPQGTAAPCRTLVGWGSVSPTHPREFGTAQPCPAETATRSTTKRATRRASPRSSSQAAQWSHRRPRAGLQERHHDVLQLRAATGLRSGLTENRQPTVGHGCAVPNSRGWLCDEPARPRASGAASARPNGAARRHVRLFRRPADIQSWMRDI
jgi:hypothetical protein